ncbi:type I asparaginase [Hymenobacter rigui]|uniref:asparaginase n=1 Tax=Hymenobacter rigui TaxID=334424 RepID=A0A428KFZ7_9BACT|nr:type I asparaginase [Hymenobacter rigui]
MLVPAVENRPQTSILIIYTGGTVGMAYNKRGELVPMNFEQIRKKMPELRQLNMQVDVTNLGDPIDSSNVTAQDWLRLAALIEEKYEHYDGFVVLHGTDTMAYSAAALSFLLENLGKTVVFTGAQVPVGRIRTDARRNLVTALEMAAARCSTAGTVRVPEVCLFFNDQLIRGNRAKKVESQQYNAFRSENYPPLAEAGIELEFNDKQIRPLPAAPLRAHQQLEENVTIVHLFPGLTERMLRAQLEAPGLRGAVLLTYGAGNAPTAPWFLQALREATGRGVLLLNVSQCEEGRVLQGRYETSAYLTEMGVLGGADITVEAAITKLMFVLALNEKPARTRELLLQDLRGEITIL